MSAKPRVGSMFVLGFEGLTVPEWVRSFASRHGLGGAILFARNCPNPAAVKALCAEIKSLANPAPLVMIDQEGGRVERLREGITRLPPAAKMAEMGVPGIEALAFDQSRELAALGVDVNLAPVCDVVRPGESGAIGDRAWGTDARSASRGAAAFYRGMRKGGVLGCAKHFPGHGASVVDTHKGAGRVELTEKELGATDLHPFRALIDEGVEFVMVSHLSYPLVDPRPACYSSFWLDEVLRRRMGFGGVIITDDMEMGAASEAGEGEANALAAVLAGADMLIYGRMMKAELGVEAVAAHLASHLSAERIAESAERVARLGGKR